MVYGTTYGRLPYHDTYHVVSYALARSSLTATGSLTTRNNAREETCVLLSVLVIVASNTVARPGGFPTLFRDVVVASNGGLHPVTNSTTEYLPASEGVRIMTKNLPSSRVVRL